jgi:hypothetical protein
MVTVEEDPMTRSAQRSPKTFTFLAATALLAAGCGNLAPDAVTSTAGGDPGTSSVRLALSGQMPANLTATYSITGPNMFSRTGNLSTGGAPSALVGGVPPGTGYTVAIDGTATDGSETCHGTATFDVMTHMTTSVTVPLVCRETLNGGSVAITSTSNVCPVVDGVASDAPSAASGGTLGLTSMAHDKDMGPSPLAYHWTATAGTFSDAAAQNPTFTCPTVSMPTNVTITLTVSDGAAGCSDMMSLMVVCG